MSGRGRRWLWSAACLGVVGLALLGGRAQPPVDRPGSPVARLLGPVAALAASVLWVDFDAALDAGRPEQAYARARLALELDPGGTEGWSYLGGQHFVRQRGSAEAESDPQRRVGWIRVGLDVLARGERSARAPEDLAVEQGLILSVLGDSELATAWPGGRAACFEEAVAAFERAAASGHPLGAGLAELAREAAAHDHRHDPAHAPEDGEPETDGPPPHRGE